MPTYVSIVTKSCSQATNLIPVQSAVKPNVYKRRFTVCLSPLNFNYGRAYELVEWIELNRLLGAEMFTIYNYSSAYNVQKVLEYYSKRGIAEVVDWKIPLRLLTNDKKSKPEIHYYGQVVQLQECLFRNKHESEFVINVDLDEFIVPRGEASNWSHMMKSMSQTAGAYIFRNTFYKKEWADNKNDFKGKNLAVQYKLVTLLKTKHEKKVFAHRQRSKYFARTSGVDRLMIHDVPSLSGTARAELVPLEKAVLHHYRNWFQVNESEDVKVEDDIVVQKYSENLIANVDSVWKELAGVPINIDPK